MSCVASLHIGTSMLHGEVRVGVGVGGGGGGRDIVYPLLLRTMKPTIYSQG